MRLVTRGSKLRKTFLIASFGTTKAFPDETAAMSFACTISILPVELLAQIIIETAANGPSAIDALMRVSRMWYNITISEPRLWNKVSLDLDYSYLAHLRAMHTARRCIERSGTVDLDISIHFTENDDTFCACYEDVGQQRMAWIDSHRSVIEVLAGTDGNHLARWCRLEVSNSMDWEYHQISWVHRALSPFINGRPTPRLRTLSFTGWLDVQLSFCHTPLLQEITLREATHFHITDWGSVKKLSLVNEPPRSLVEKGSSTIITHLILHMPIFCPQLTLPNVTYLEILDNDEANYSLEPPILPRVKHILISTGMDDVLHKFPLHQYPTIKLLSLRYQPLRASALFINSLFRLIMSSCNNLEALDVDDWLFDSIRPKSRYLPSLKQLFLMGKEVELWPTNTPGS